MGKSSCNLQPATIRKTRNYNFSSMRFNFQLNVVVINQLSTELFANNIYCVLLFWTNYFQNNTLESCWSIVTRWQSMICFPLFIFNMESSFFRINFIAICNHFTCFTIVMLPAVWLEIAGFLNNQQYLQSLFRSPINILV